MVFHSFSPLSSLSLLQTGAVHEEFYKDCDLTVGGEVNVWGRRVIIADCDDFTKDYYRIKYGIGTQSYFFISALLQTYALFLQTK